MPPVPKETSNRIGKQRETSGAARFRSSLPVILLLFAVLFIVSACDDPTSVGSDLLGDETADPQRVRLLPTETASESIDKKTGSVRGNQAFSGVISTVLTGDVVDPILGSRSATGNIDFRKPSFPEGFIDAPIDYVELRLVVPYIYGDTTAVNELALLEIAAAWDPADLVASSELATGEEIMRVQYQPADSSVVVRLPSGWVEQNEDVLLSTDFNDLFHGIQLRPVSSTAIIGVSASGTSLTVANNVDTLAYVPDRLFTHLDREDAAELPAGTLPILDGFGTAMRLNFDFDGQAADSPALSRVTVRIPTLNDLLQPDSLSGFTRPLIQQLYLYAVDSGGTQTLLATTFRNAEGEFAFVGSASSSAESILGTIQSAVLGKQPFDHLLLSAPAVLLSISPVLVPVAGTTGIPETILTLVPS